jgi:quinol monooxygenase YgiN
MLEQVVRLAVDLTIKEGELEAFKTLAVAMTEGSGREPGTIGYEWFFGGDGRRCRLLETYQDGEAVLAHFTGPVVRDLLPQLVPLCTLDRFEIYGDPGPEATRMATGFGAQFYSYWTGLKR